MVPLSSEVMVRGYVEKGDFIISVSLLLFPIGDCGRITDFST